MKYHSTRHLKRDIIDFKTALSQGVALDGGLFVPDKFPTFSSDRFSHLASLNFSKLASTVLIPFLRDEMELEVLEKICDKAFNFPIPVKEIKDHFVLELFHGPTCAFKDVGARFLAGILKELYPKISKTILVATSGDTGGAVGGAFSEYKDTQTFILFPKNKISNRQQQQLTCWGKNVKAFAVNGNFDDCQAMAKQILANPEMRKNKTFFSANSISLGRILPQMIYYIKSSLELWKKNSRNSSFIIPSGNLGNAVAAFWAKSMGFPIERIILATNANHTLVDYVSNGLSSHSGVLTVATLANAMDVAIPSNLERLSNLTTWQELQNICSAWSITDDEIKQTIKNVFNDSKYIICPHTATAFAALSKAKFENENRICVATAHPAKFETIIEPIINQTVSIPPQLQRVLKLKSVFIEIENNIEALEKELLS